MNPTFQITLLRPVSGTITQEFGQRLVDYSRYGLIAHNGQDIAAPTGTPIHAPISGQCWCYDDPEGYGLTVEIWYPEISLTTGVYKTICAHMSEITVPDHKYVQAGDLIGRVGSTGNSTGPHTHWSIKFLRGSNPGYRDWSDPRPYLAP